VRISLVSPKWNKMVNSYPPLGLGYLAAVLEREGHQVRIHDFGLTPNTPLEEDIQDIEEFAPHLVGITSMTNVYHSALETARLVKERMGCPVVMGGPHPTVFPQRTVQEPWVDYVVYGEGEETLVELVRALEGQMDLEGVQGLCFKRNGEVILNPARPLIRDLDGLPFPARHLYRLLDYPLFAPNGERMLTLLSSRGCPYNCSYCFKGIVGRTYRQRSPDNIVAELRLLIQRYDIRNFYFIDDLFTLDLRRLDALLDRFIEERLDIRWQCLARVDRVTPQILRKMHRAGCRQIHYGIESGNQEVLDRVGKGITLEQVRRAIAWTAEAGIRSKGYFMLGLPGDTEETIRQTIELAAELPLDEAMFSITTPFPGTRLWDELVRKHPGTEFTPDFTRAYYYDCYTEEIPPFLNVSEVSDRLLARLAVEAKEHFAEAKRRRRYHRFFGPRWGEVMWRISCLPGVRAVGRKLIETGVLKGWKGLREERKKPWD